MALLPPLASLEDVENWLGRQLSTEEARRASQHVRAGSALVRSYTGLDYLDEDDSSILIDPLPEAVPIVVVMVAKRLLLDPDDGVSQVAIEGFSESYRSSGLYLTTAEKEMLDGQTGNQLVSLRVKAPDFGLSTDAWFDELVESDP
jgi:hypothetical protein